MNKRPVKGRFFRTVGCAMCLMAMLAMLGGHWVALQSFAWARMVGQFARQESLTRAFAKTFDGRHPCALCVLIKESRQQEQRENQRLPLAKLGEAPDLLCDVELTRVPLPPVAATRAVPFVPRWHAGFLDSPPTPPPRVG
jgi:hypothetical protein